MRDFTLERNEPLFKFERSESGLGGEEVMVEKGEILRLVAAEL